MSKSGDSGQTDGSPDAVSGAEGQPGSVERQRLRRRLFGYRAADVDGALDARDTELAELRQDVAALWLAFAQHDRMIRGALEPRPAEPPPPTPPAIDDAPEAEVEVAPPQDAPASDAEIGRQLSDLDDVLAAIELATQTLERTYTDEIEPGAPAHEPPETQPAEPEEPTG